LSVISIILTPLNKEREKPKKYGANAPQLHPIWPQAATGAHSPAPSDDTATTATTATSLLAQTGGFSQQAGARIAITPPTPGKAQPGRRGAAWHLLEQPPAQSIVEAREGASQLRVV